jgi:hypothetical protein
MLGLGCGDQESGSGSAGSATTGSGGGATTGSASSTTAGSGGGATAGSGGSTTAGSGGGGGGSGSATAAASTGTFMSTPCTGNTCDIDFSGSGFTPHDGQTLYAGVIPQGSSMGFDWQDSATVMAGAFSLQGSAVLQKGTAYFLNYYADVNQNGICEPNQGDHIWRLSLPPVQDNVVVTVVHHTNFSNLGCGGF